MQSGRLRHRVTIQEQTIARDAAGGETVTWTNIATNPTVWAQVIASQAAREGYLSGGEQVQAVASYIVRMRYRDDIDVKMRVVWDGKNLDIQNVLDPDGRERELRLMCEAVI